VLLQLQELQHEFQLTYLFISHGMPMVAQVANHISAMGAGLLLNQARLSAFLTNRSSPIPRKLLAAVPDVPWPSQV
jgi:peptide/nickel transport system ATP-binding protein